MSAIPPALVVTVVFLLIGATGMFERVYGGDGPQMDLPIFDTHVHYKEPAWPVYPPNVIIEMMERAGVTKALV